jgi:GNAT superfamily N-acetyltransferase
MIRPATADDVEPVVGLLDAVLPPEDRVSLEEFLYGETMRDPNDAFNRLVAVAASQAVAVAETGNHIQSRPPHMFRLIVAVRPDFQRRGIGSELERRQRTYAIEHGGSELTAMIREDDHGSRVFLDRLGYREAYQRFEMELDVTRFDWSRFPEWRRRLDGLRLRSFAELGLTDEMMRRMYDLSMLLAKDVPHPDGPPRFSFEEFKMYFGAPGFRPDGLLLLTDGDEWVGTSGVFTPEGRPGYTYFTGVRREYRGRGLATALKLATIEFAQRNGIGAMRTNNDTANYAMVAVNEKLGYRRLPARVAMKWTRLS